MAKILIIDDDEALREILCVFLNNQGHEMFTAVDGVDGVRCFFQCQPDIVITDIVMPNKDGIGVITELRRFNPNVCIIAMSGDSRVLSAGLLLRTAKSLGTRHSLVKPFLLDELLKLINFELSATTEISVENKLPQLTGENFDNYILFSNSESVGWRS